MLYEVITAGVDLFYKVLFDNIGTLDFFKFKQAYEAGIKQADQFENDLKDQLL